MPIMHDIYRKVDSEIVEKGFYDQDNAGKKELIETGLKNYISNKITEFSPTKHITEEMKKEMSVIDLAETLGEIIPQKDHFDTMRHLTHYVVAVAGDLQGRCILWYGSDSEEYIDNPIVSFNEDGHWDSLTSHRFTSYTKTFDIAYETLNTMILGKEKKAPQLTMTKEQLPKSDN